MTSHATCLQLSWCNGFNGFGVSSEPSELRFFPPGTAVAGNYWWQTTLVKASCWILPLVTILVAQTCEMRALSRCLIVSCSHHEGQLPGTSMWQHAKTPCPLCSCQRISGSPLRGSANRPLEECLVPNGKNR